MKLFIKNSTQAVKRHSWLQKAFFVKCMLLFFVLGTLHAAASLSYSQSTRLTINMEKTTVREVLSTIEKTSDFYFTYNSSEINAKRKVSVRVEDRLITDILNELFAGENVSYTINDKHVVLYKNETKNTATASVSQQTRTITVVVNDELGEVAGANVSVKGTTLGNITDADGKAVINNVPANAVLVVSYIGYKTQEISVGNQTTITVQLAEDTQALEEVVVLGYGASAKKKDLSAAVGVIAAPEELAKRPVTSTQAMLQGQIPGVTVSANDGGDPSKTPAVSVRGQGSQGRNGENKDGLLWVVDGVPGAPVGSLSEIESIVVLKDAASAAIYGAQSGAGGVILVTTKKGKSGVSMSYDGLVGIRTATNKLESLNAEEELLMRKQSYANAGLELPMGWDTSKNPWVGTTRTNWMDEIFRSAIYHRHNIGFNAGSDNFKNRISFNFGNEDGTLVGTYKKEMGIKYRGDIQLNKWVRFTEDLSWIQNDSRGADTESGYTGAVISAIYMPQSASRYQYDGTGYGGTTTEDPAYIAQYGSNFADIHGDVVNPLRSLLADNRYNRYTSLYNTAGMEIANIVPGLKFNSRFSYNTNQEFTKNFSPMRPEIGKPSLSNSLSYHSYKTSKWQTENSLTYDNTFGAHTIGALLATTADHYEKRYFDTSASGFSDESPSLQYFAWSTANSQPTDYLEGPDANVAIIARLAYSFDDRYFMTASWRRDYASRLPKDNNYGDFPAVTAAWKLSNEKFWKKNDFINLLKLRASWGRVGNLGSIDYNYSSAILSKKGWNNQSMQYGYETAAGYCGQFFFNGTAVNQTLTWETSEQLDFGLDMSMLKDRLSVAFDFYNKRTYNLIQTQPSGWPKVMGIDAPYVNMGEVRNRGVEVSLGWNDRIGKDWSYYINGNLGYNKNWVSDMGYENEDGSDVVWVGRNGKEIKYRGMSNIYQTKEDEPLNSFYMIKCLGIFQSDAEAAAWGVQPEAKAGDLKFEDFNGDGKIDSNDRQYLGNAEPDFTYAINGGFTFKDLSFSLMLQGVQGAQAAYMAKFSLLSDVEGNFNRSRDILDAWSPSNTGSDIPRLSKNDPNTNFNTVSSWYLEDASYLRLKNITLSYDLTRILRKSTHFLDRGSSLSVYFSGENLFTITSYSGMDPECGGYDALKYPVSRVLSFGVRLTY